MISSVSDNPPDGTQHVPDGAAPTETQFVPDGPAPESSAPRFGDRAAELPRFGRFRALAELGAGAMGTVFRAQDDVLGRSVAIKALSSKDASIKERFLREARAIGAVLHPNILAVYDAGSDADTPYLVMELAAGGSLRDRLKLGPLPVETTRELGIQIARALAAAHAANIVHRDVKPANILNANDVWKLADFGIARLPDSTLTVEGQFLGSPSYAAPESLRAGEFSPASDIYGLGATLYEALVGTPPHGDHDMRSVIRKLEADPPPLSTHRPLPASLEAAIMATLARDPARRPSADQLAHMLAVTGDDRIAAAPHGPSARTKLVALVLAAVATGFVIFAVTRHNGGSSAKDLQPMFDPREKLAPPPAKHDFAKPPPDQQDRNTPPDNEAPIEPSQPQPQVVDPWGNPVDDDTAKQILEQMQRDAESQLPLNGRKHGKRKHRGD
jgi:serine/threonine-protein kinase